MIRVLMVCHGNICRSPMAEFVLKDMVNKRGISENFLIESAATSDEECYNGYGNPVYPPAQAELKRHGIGVPGNELGLSAKRARQLTPSDYDKWDYIIAMERSNLRGISRILGDDPGKKVHLLMDFTGQPEDIADPWYSGDFAGVYKQIVRGCESFLAV
ncbi:MAG: low molecular weight phosphotyrosine protein phosphatase [Lachnospiraceae bacterium]|nr:low molecular weight phosphotyrosine protein phosphatase [Lachnospiraceae bacterium]